MKIKKTRNFGRMDLAKMFGEMGFVYGAEIGVRRGDYSETLCTQIKSLKTLYSVDPWNVVYEDPTSAKFGAARQERYYNIAKEKLSKYPVCKIVKKTSLEAVRDIEYESLDFVYIDGSHMFDYVMVDLIEWGKRVRKGGIISGDDYKELTHGNVIDAVNTYAKVHGIEVLNVFDPPDDDPYYVNGWWFYKK